MMHLTKKANPVGKGNLALDIQERKGSSADVRYGDFGCTRMLA